MLALSPPRVSLALGRIMPLPPSLRHRVGESGAQVLRIITPAFAQTLSPRELPYARNISRRHPIV